MIVLGKCINYEVYETKKIKKSDTSCLDQNTKNEKIVTLITCDNINNNIRYTVKAREIK